ncbi:ABC transporter substrate-binding protein [Paraburkholderia kururiensis]|uniref:ABC transporter substrate-binding protein n=1 Tax=Paraburkholderia kururiensis TaxID=984307 RepID=A0ABZ0WMH2_9BURK|nr:ABC transporter substrate-binding protein [Paraburkholderia kururiensis]WQD78529.1 ABC transporter substrate-binding protein [Paraburkholderia kururiensis]
MVGAVGMAYGQAATGNTSSMKIALSNNYAGNSWRQTMLKSWAEVADPAVKSGVVAAAPTFTTAENQATEQAQQIQNLILQGYKAIVIDAASPTALNGVIKQACGAGVTVVTFDGIATEPCAYRIAVDFHKLGSMQVDYMAKRLNGKGNLLEIRGLAGVSVDDEIHRGIVDELKKYPGLKIVGSVHGDWTQTVAQKQVAGILPTLPKIDGVVAQGGDGYGAANAIKEAGRPTPIIILGNRQEELAWWAAQRKTGNYDTLSVTIPPGCSTFAFWVAQQLLAGKKLPHDIQMPLLEVQADQLDSVLAKTPQGGLANKLYTRDEVLKVVDAK